MIDYAAARQSMVDCQVRPSDVTRYQIIEAMLWAPREMFVPKARRDVAYAETDIDLGAGRILLAARTMAKMLETAAIGPDDLVLDLAPGLGYSTALISRLAAAVVAVEPDEAMASQAADLLAGLDLDNVIINPGNAAAGNAEHGPYDVIFIGGGIETVPDALAVQLKQGGRLIALVQDGAVGQCRRVVRAGESLSERREFDAVAPVLPGFEKEHAFTF